MKSAQKRSENISSDVNTNRILPCAGVRMLPVMFWIQPSVPSSTAPTRAWVQNRTNSSIAPIEKLVLMPTISSSTAATPQHSTLHVRRREERRCR